MAQRAEPTTPAEPDVTANAGADPDRDREAVLELEDLRTEIATDHGPPLTPVDGVSLRCEAGRTLAVVGESGSGKSMTFMSVTGLLPHRARVAGGDVRYRGESLRGRSPRALRRLRGSEIAVIYQDSLTGLNPAFTVGNQLAEIYRVHRRVSRREARGLAIDALERVQIPNPAARAKQYPYQLSGGMRQRAMIAMGIALNPRVLIADEPTTALDVTIQAQVLELLDSLRRDLDMAMVLITHDLGVVARFAHDVAVMYAGQVVEQGPVADVFARPRHPYTVALQRSSPRPDQSTGALAAIGGQPPQLSAIPPGCPFHPRCFLAGGRADCRSERPTLRPLDAADHLVACHHAEELEDTP